jgi:hypothetical protein
VGRWERLSVYAGVFLVSLATLAFEVTLTRLFSVAQWYHFAFMAVSLALLGFGASGSILAVAPRLVGSTSPARLAALAAAFALAILGSYLVVNYLPFDSYRIAWEREQVVYLVVYYLALAAPFLASGLLIGGLLAAQPERAGPLYAANLLGSGVGCLATLAVLPWVGGAGAVTFAALAAMLGALAFAMPHLRLAFCILVVCVALATLLPLRPPLLEIQLSPYKSLSQLLRFPDTRVLSSRWNAYSRVDVIESQAIKSAPGLSFAFPGTPPPQWGITVDGDNLSPVTRHDDPAFTDYLPTALAYCLIDHPRVLVLEPGGGLDVLVALDHDAAAVVAVESNDLVAEAVREQRDFAGDLFGDPRVRLVVEDGRSYVHRSTERFDLVQISLADTFKVVNAGAYSLSEDYRYTVEAFIDYLEHLTPTGFLVVGRWLQLPPSEEIRAAALAADALDRLGIEHPQRHIAALRSWSTLLLLVKHSELTDNDLATVRRFAAERRFDLVYLPGLTPDEANRYNVLRDDVYYRAFHDLLLGPDRARFFGDYPFEVAPTTDDRPFFFHFFKLSQTPYIVQTFGKTWQPFGGGGYFVLIALLVLAVTASVVLILAPLALRWQKARAPARGRFFAYFSLLGLGYLFVEIPLMQRFILFLGHPIYAFAAVLFALLVASGVGSFVSARFPLRAMLAVLVAAIVAYPLLLPIVFGVFLGQGLAMRLVVAVVVLAPLGFVMGMPFPKGLALVHKIAPGLIPWAWGVNGCASVLSSILAAMVTVSFGFTWVLAGAAASYAAAMLAVFALADRP